MYSVYSVQRVQRVQCTACTACTVYSVYSVQCTVYTVCSQIHFTMTRLDSIKKPNKRDRKMCLEEWYSTLQNAEDDYWNDDKMKRRREGEKNSGESDFGSNTKRVYKKKTCSLIQNRLRVGRKWGWEKNTGSAGEWKDPAEEEGWTRMADPDGGIEIKRGVSRAEPGVLSSMHACFGLSCVEIFFCFALLLSLGA